LYHYTGATAGRELFISNVPFFDPLSFPFLAYASYCLARWALRQSRGWQTVALAGVLMTGLDVFFPPPAAPPHHSLLALLSSHSGSWARSSVSPLPSSRGGASVARSS